jgi:hypothetical protein
MAQIRTDTARSSETKGRHFCDCGRYSGNMYGKKIHRISSRAICARSLGAEVGGGKGLRPRDRGCGGLVLSGKTLGDFGCHNVLENGAIRYPILSKSRERWWDNASGCRKIIDGCRVWRVLRMMDGGMSEECSWLNSN